MLLYVTSALDEDERRAAHEHLQTGCPICADHLAEAEAVVAQLALTLEPQATPAELRRRLFAGLESRSQRRDRFRPSPRSTLHRVVQTIRRQAAVWLIVATAMFASGAFGALYVKFSSDISAQSFEINNLRRKILHRDDMIKQLQARFAESQDQLRGLQSRKFEVIVLGGRDHQPRSAWGHILWDRRNSRWLFFAHGMKPTASERLYQLWFVSIDGQSISAGTFEVDENGNGSLRTSLPKEIGAFQSAGVTEEPIGGSSSPTGELQLLSESRSD